ncbi:MAG: S-adenosylmethionine:tRNA ribosyltransferase-isomerase [Prevotellaceae bacterium]|jgi:S-adenosylmethionine:tRNA ribosyltransferase-isomerase|nr:S-adenosylmethionine:tRNA ribosyltransferase-isomerase [Prevotellaceae bacterium]
MNNCCKPLPEIPDIRIADYDYPLPDERIARFPAAQRDRAKLLTYAAGNIGHTVFTELPALLPPHSLLVFNETKVIPARLLFRKDTGAVIEIFCLEPLLPAGYEACFAATESCEWRCLAGHSKRWKSGRLYLSFGEYVLSAEWLEKQTGSVRVRFAWNGNASFAQVLEQCGQTPLPPYLKRDALPEDTVRYQTIYARYNGSVAAPTAGLHFSPAVLGELAQRGIASETLTLHVGAGTFRPVKSETIAAHVMHGEPFTVSRRALQNILAHTGNIIAVGTTATRALESLYFLGVQCLHGQPPEAVAQWEPYRAAYHAAPQEALQALLQYMENNQLENLHAVTRLLIAPPYPFRTVSGMVTNFHQPQSTLLLLVSAFIGEDWRRVYRYALQNDFRFLSYGDSSYLIKS